MVEGLIGKKIGMTQTFDEDGNVAPVTVIKAGPCTVIQKKKKEKDGYSALQLGLVEEKGRKKTTRPLIGHYKKAGIPPMKILREFRFEEGKEVKEGDQFFVDIFQVGEKVHVLGTSKGKGFAGVVKRWGFHGGKASHGSMFHRAPGSIGASAFPSRVVKGKKLPGHMGNRRVTARNLKVIQADKENNLLVVKGAVPGAKGGYLLIKKANFHPEFSKAEQAKLDQVKAEKPKSEQPRPEPSKPEQVKPEQPKVEQPKQPEQPEQVKPEQPEPKKARPKAKQPEPEQPVPSKPEQVKTEKSQPKKPKQEQPKAEKPESKPSQNEDSKEEKKE